jgi:hypothetical protein
MHPEDYLKKTRKHITNRDGINGTSSFKRKLFSGRNARKVATAFLLL